MNPTMISFRVARLGELAMGELFIGSGDAIKVAKDFTAAMAGGHAAKVFVRSGRPLPARLAASQVVVVSFTTPHGPSRN
jgi:hypothetical protein